jgi:transcriptional regulator with XRE-family HTH domain
MSGFGEKVRGYRKGRGITQNALAKAAGLTPTYFNRIEKGTRKIPKVETVLALVAALHGLVHLKPQQAKELVELAGYSPEVLWLGGGLVYDSPPLYEPHVPFDQLFRALARLSSFEPETQRRCIEAIIALIEAEERKENNA